MSFARHAMGRPKNMSGASAAKGLTGMSVVMEDCFCMGEIVNRPWRRWT